MISDRTERAMTMDGPWDWEWFTLWQWSGQLSQDWQRVAQARRIRKKRGARKRPQLSPIARRLETALLASYKRLEFDIIASLRGRSDDIATGRIHQAISDEESAALDYYGLSEEDGQEPIDHSREAAILLLLALWRRRHQAIAEEEVGSTFQIGRKEALKQLKLENALPSRETSALRDEVLKKFGVDVDRLEKGLREGTPRSPGIETILGSATTLSQAARELRFLFDEESFRLKMYSEAIVWSSWLAGFRAGAVEGTQQLHREGVSLDQLPEFVWSGPNDTRVCVPCGAQFGVRIKALSVFDLPDPTIVCAYGRACRHYWRRVS
jgi:hypothetical protein